jgi:hypothetical protein
MHMDEVAGSCHLLQRVDILRDREHLPGKVALEPCEREMRRIRPRLDLLAPAQIVEAVHLGGIASKAFRRRHLLEIELRPQAALITKGAEPALSGEARAGEDDNVVEPHTALGFDPLPVSTSSSLERGRRRLRWPSGRMPAPYPAVGGSLWTERVVVRRCDHQEVGGPASVSCCASHYMTGLTI